MTDTNPRAVLGGNMPPDPLDLVHLLDCNAITGALTWRKRLTSMFSAERYANSWNNRYAGTPALNSAKGGYLYGRIHGKPYFAHRVIWAIHHGEWPVIIDHINGDGADNRIDNLRSVSHKDNIRNSKLSIANSSGACGVYWSARNLKWAAQMRLNGKTKYLGIYEKFDDAVAARKSADVRYGFHENHGRDS